MKQIIFSDNRADNCGGIRRQERGGKMEKNQGRNWMRRGVLATISARSNSDVLGSYTGTPKDPDDPHPVQDVDDL